MPAVAAALGDETDSDSEYEDDEDDEDDDDYQAEIDQAAARERANIRFAKKKTTMTTEAFEFFAASKIAALYRGYCTRKMYSEIIHIRTAIDTITAKILCQKSILRLEKNAAALYKKSITTMTYMQWRHHSASVIQKAWHAKVKREKADQLNFVMITCIGDMYIIADRGDVSISWSQTPLLLCDGVA